MLPLDVELLSTLTRHFLANGARREAEHSGVSVATLRSPRSLTTISHFLNISAPIVLHPYTHAQAPITVGHGRCRCTTTVIHYLNTTVLCPRRVVQPLREEEEIEVDQMPGTLVFVP